MKRTTTFILAILFLLRPVPALAWGEGYHALIAWMAFNQLSKDEQAKLFEILAKHPRYNDDFVPPKASKVNERDLKIWKIGRVGYWPDVARSHAEFHREKWHFELGSTLAIGSVRLPKTPGALPSDATMETQDLSSSQALELCSTVLSDKASSNSDRALALCWIGHLVADIHQPCNAGSLYMEGVFAEYDGDRWANRIFTKQSGNLHDLWDGLLDPDEGFNDISWRIFKMVQEVTFREFEMSCDDQFLAETKRAAESDDPKVWLLESQHAAKQFVYSEEVLRGIKNAKGLTKEDPIDLPYNYLRTAHKVARQRAAMAAYRLAERWKAGLK